MQAFFVSGAGRWPLAALAAVAAALVVAVTRGGPGRQAPAAPVTAIVGWDASGSARPRLAAFVHQGVGLLRRLEPGRDRAMLFRMDRQTVAFFEGGVPDSRETLLALLVRELRPLPPRDGTFPAAFWRAAAERAAETRTPVVVLLLTDGGNDDDRPAARAALDEAVRRLAANRRVRRVCLWGVIPSCREALREAFAPLGDRVEIRGLDDADPGAVTASAHAPPPPGPEEGDP